MVETSSVFPASEIKNLARIWRSIPPIERIVTPVNLEDCRQEFLSRYGRPYNPKFKYNYELVNRTIGQIEQLKPLETLVETPRELYRIQGGRTAHSDLILHSLDLRLQELRNYEDFLKAMKLGDNDGAEGRIRALAQIYGSHHIYETSFAQGMLVRDFKEVCRSNKYRDPSTSFAVDYADNRERFFRNILHSFKGTYSEAQKSRLRALEFDSAEVANYLRSTIRYVNEHASYIYRLSAAEQASPSYMVEASQRWKTVTVLHYTAGGKGVIGIPKDLKINGLELVLLVNKIFSGYFRSAMSTRNYFRTMIDPYRDESELIPLIPLLSHSMNETLSKGLETLVDIQIRGGSGGLLEPYSILAVQLANDGYNFYEVADEIRSKALRYFAKHHRHLATLKGSADEIAWGITWQAFRGQHDTSTNKFGYAFPKGKDELCGFTAIVGQLGRFRFESIVKLLRYSTLTLDELKTIDSFENSADGVIDHDPFEGRSYSLGPKRYADDDPNPAQWITRQLLDDDGTLAAAR